MPSLHAPQDVQAMEVALETAVDTLVTIVERDRVGQPPFQCDHTSTMHAVVKLAKETLSMVSATCQFRDYLRPGDIVQMVTSDGSRYNGLLATVVTVFDDLVIGYTVTPDAKAQKRRVRIHPLNAVLVGRVAATTLPTLLRESSDAPCFGV